VGLFYRDLVFCSPKLYYVKNSNVAKTCAWSVTWKVNISYWVGDTFYTSEAHEESACVCICVYVCVCICHKIVICIYVFIYFFRWEYVNIKVSMQLYALFIVVFVSVPHFPPLADRDGFFRISF